MNGRARAAGCKYRGKFVGRCRWGVESWNRKRGRVESNIGEWGARALELWGVSRRNRYIYIYTCIYIYIYIYIHIQTFFIYVCIDYERVFRRRACSRGGVGEGLFVKVGRQ